VPVTSRERLQECLPLFGLGLVQEKLLELVEQQD
jgi:hypothetical protein